ncbi:hypothetical protein KJ359_006374 [Pestalotiopsis sp. 9143b]|nr:hypothetical protein KJ359_006374 [Pestalotiopsis sp. 9143b]
MTPTGRTSVNCLQIGVTPSQAQTVMGTFRTPIATTEEGDYGRTELGERRILRRRAKPWRPGPDDGNRDVEAELCRVVLLLLY